MSFVLVEPTVVFTPEVLFAEFPEEIRLLNPVFDPVVATLPVLVVDPMFDDDPVVLFDVDPRLDEKFVPEFDEVCPMSGTDALRRAARPVGAESRWR